MIPYSDDELENMIDQQIYYNNYSAAEVDYLVDRAVSGASYVANEQTRYLKTFCIFLTLIGLEHIALAIRAANWGWQKLRDFWGWVKEKTGLSDVSPY